MLKRGLIALALVWSILWFAPMFRAQTQRMRAPLGVRSGPWPYAPLLGAAELARLARENPANGALALAEFRARARQTGGDDAYWREFNDLVARFPDDLDVRRARLQKATVGGIVLQTYEPIPPNTSRVDGEEYKRKWQNAAQREIVVRQARIGAAQAPDDGYFPWIEAMALWNENDEPALRALERAAECRDFNNGIYFEARQIFGWREKQGPLSWVEKFAALNAVLVPDIAQMSALQREVVWSGIARYNKGDKTGAYRRWRIALEAGAAYRRAQSGGPNAFLLAMLVGETMQKSVWDTVARELNPMGQTTRATAPYQSRLNAFVALARRDKQDALADYALAEQANFQARIVNPGRTMTAEETALGLRSTATRLSLQLPWAARRVLDLTLVGAAALAACLLGHRFSEAKVGKVSPAQIAFFSALWLGVLLLLSLVRVSPEMRVIYGLSSLDAPVLPLPFVSQIIESPPPSWLCIALTLGLATALCHWQSARDDRALQRQILRDSPRSRRPMQWLIVAIALICLLVVPLFSLSLAASGGADATLLRLGCDFIIMLALGLALLHNERFSQGDKARGRVAWLSAFCALLAFVLASQFGFFDNIAVALASAILLLCAGASLVYLAATATAWRPLFMRAFTTALQTLGGVALVCSVALLLASLAALPVRARQNSVVDDYIARGEIDWMKSQPSIASARAQ